MLTNTTQNGQLLVGALSDTHGHLAPAAMRALAGVDAIIHAGDIGRPELLDELRKIAPVAAVKGNMDGGKWTRELSDTEVVALGGIVLYVLHDLYRLDLDPEASGFQAVIYGHTHIPEANQKNGVWYINPGSATYPKRLRSASLALIRITKGALDVEWVNLDRV